MLVRTGFGAQSLAHGELLALSFSPELFPTPISITDSPLRRITLTNHNVRFYSDLKLMKASNAYALTGLRSGHTEEILAIGYSNPEPPRGSAPVPAENDYFNFVDTTTEFILAIEFPFRSAVAGLLLMDCILGADENYIDVVRYDELSFWANGE